MMNPEDFSQDGSKPSQVDQQDDFSLKALDRESIEKLKEWYKVAIERKQTKLQFLIVFLCALSICQFVIVDYSFFINFGVDKDSLDLFTIIPIILIGGLITAALPITTFIDEFRLLEHPLDFTINGKKFSPIIWIILPADFILTFQAIYTLGEENAEKLWLVTVLGFLTAAVFATSSLYTSRGIAASFTQLKEAQKHFQILQIYRINPIDLHEDVEKLKLRKQLDQAISETEKIKNELSKQISKLSSESLAKLDKKQQEIKELEEKISLFKEDVASINKLRASFNKIRGPIVELIGQSKNIFGKFSELDESVQSFHFPRVELRIPVSKNGSSPPQPVYYMKWQNSNYSWEDLRLPSEPSAVGRRLLSLILQQGNLPRPNVQDFRPRSNLSSCMVLRFEEYNVVVYCRDESYKHGETWTHQDQVAFEEQVVSEQNLGLRVLRFSPQEIMSNPEKVLERISDALSSQLDLEVED